MANDVRRYAKRVKQFRENNFCKIVEDFHDATPPTPKSSPTKWVGFGEEERRSERAFVCTDHGCETW